MQFLSVSLLRRTLLPLLLCSVATSSLRGQHSSSGFEQKEASSLYSEWGFQNGSSMSVDGSIIVSNATGQLSYSYPISSHTVKGAPIRATLNYSGSVGFTSFKEYRPVYSIDYLYRDENRQIRSGNCSDLNPGWIKFHMNRPAWILGVNGFAVQVFSATHGFAPYRPIVDDRCRLDFTHEDLVWAIDGYDYSNRMEDFAAPGYYSTLRPKIDVIRLLRSDGSLLELYNSNNPPLNAEDPADLYTGHYFVNAPNADGFAIVEFDNTLTPRFVADLLQVQTNDLKPRKVRYYPGDGLEYVFRERLAPYGVMEYSDDPQDKHRLYKSGIRRLICFWSSLHGSPQAIYEYHILGGAKASPTIFYLDEIRNSQGTVTTFTYSRHQSTSEAPTRGRAQVEGFSGHNITYGDGQVLITALGRTISLLLNKSLTTGVNGNLSCPLRTFEDRSRWYGNGRYDWGDVSKSTLGYVTKIIEQIGENEQRVTRFEYDTYRRVYRNWRFPHVGNTGYYQTSRCARSGPDEVTMRLKDLRLSEVVEPAQTYRFCYYDSKSDYSCSATPAPVFPIRPGAPLTATAEQYYDPPFGYNKSVFPYLRNNVVRHVEKFTSSGTPLKRETYSFSFPLHYDTIHGRFLPTEEYRSVADSSTVHVVDLVENTTVKRDYTYRFSLLPKIRKFFVRGSFSNVAKIVESDGNRTTTTWTKYSEGELAAYAYLPKSRVVKVEQKSPGKTSAIASAVGYSYTLEAVRDYGGAVGSYISGKPTFQSIMGKEVLQRRVTEIDPSTVSDDPVTGEPDVTTGAPYRIRKTTYKNFPYSVATFSKSSTAWDERTTEAAFNLNASEYRSFEDVAFDPIVIRTKTETLGPTVAMPPVIGLLEEDYIEDPNGNYLRGSLRSYQTEPYDGSTSTFRGMLLSEKVYGPGRLTELPGNRYRYTDWWNKSLLGEIENANGGVAKSYYNFEMPHLLDTETGGYDLPEGILKRNNNRTVSKKLPSDQYFAYMYEKPIADETRVRKYDPSRTLRTDTIRSYKKLTYGALPGIDIDPNGWITRTDVDPLGRLKMAWLPYDFPEPEPIVSGATEQIELNRSIEHIKRQDTVRCNSDGTNKEILEGRRRTTYNGSYLHTTKYKTPIPDCPECDSDETSCQVAYTGLEEVNGYLDYRVKSGDKLEAISAAILQEARLRLYVASSSRCTTLEVDIPILGFKEAYLLNCRFVDHVATRTEREDGEKGGSTAQVPEKNPAKKVNDYLYVDLIDARDALENLVDGSHLEIFLRAKTPGATVAFSNKGDATRPVLYVKGGVYTGELSEKGDYTLAVDLDDKNLRSEILAKVDDRNHTAQTPSRPPVSGEARRRKVEHQFGHDYLLKHTDVTIGDPDAPIRVDRTEFDYDGRGNLISRKDAEGNITTSESDAFDRVIEVTNPDASRVTQSYEYGGPGDAGLTPDDPDYNDYFGYTYVERRVDEAGIPTEQFYDAFGRVLRQRTYKNYPDEPIDVLYSYDILDQLLAVTHPNGEQTQYTYDDFGRVKSKQHPDLGTISYAYDKVGNLRFLQGEEQARKDRITFNEYDDLNRLVIVGEAVFSDQSRHGTPVGPPGGGRWTDVLDPTVLHDEGNSGILTANMTLWFDPASYGKSIPTFWSTLDTIFRDCPEMKMINPDATGPFLKHKAEVYEPTNEISMVTDFENLAKHPENVRIAIGYDRMPDEAGPVWGTFPSKSTWDGLAPKGSVRNLKGREAAVAYREHGGEPFHYSVMSYDERGRPEALLRYTDNLGFDAVYYRYNSMNQVISVTTADPLRQHTTWYGYDNNARVNSVWTQLGDVGTGLGHVNPTYPPTPLNRPLDAQITYVYTPTDQVDRMSYPAVGVDVAYSYDNRLRLDRIDADRNGADLFLQQLSYEPTGEITRQLYRHGTGSSTTQTYTYDDRRQLTGWTPPSMPTRSYRYDAMGNRGFEGGFVDLLTGNSIGHYYRYVDPKGPNRLREIIMLDFTAQLAYPWLTFSYDADGAMIQKREIDATGMSIKREERFGYSSWRDLLSSYRLSAGSSVQEWRYRYNAMGERESKRLYRKLRISRGGGDRHHDMTIAPDTTVVRVEVTRVSGDPPFFHGLVSIGGDAREATFSENTIIFSDTALADLGENIIIYGEATLTTNNSDTTMVNFIGEVRVDSAEVSGDPVIFHGLVNIGGDTTGITFSGDTVIVPDTVEFIEPFSDSLIITISGNTARITFPDTVIIAVDSTKPPSNPASTAVFGGARLTMRNYKSSSASRHEWTYYLLGGTKEQLSVWQGTQTSEVGFCGSTRGDDVYFYPTEYLTYAIEYPGIREDIPRLRLQPDGGIEYRITDHLGSNRVTLDGSGVVTNRYDYKPFGGILSSGGEARQGFNSREKDQESDLFNNGVRKLDDNIGRFTSIDPLWEKFPSWSPYQYGYNNPLRVTDPSGMQGEELDLTVEIDNLIYSGTNSEVSLIGDVLFALTHLTSQGALVTNDVMSSDVKVTMSFAELTQDVDWLGHESGPGGPAATTNPTFRIDTEGSPLDWGRSTTFGLGDLEKFNYSHFENTSLISADILINQNYLTHRKFGGSKPRQIVGVGQAISHEFAHIVQAMFGTNEFLRFSLELKLRGIANDEADVESYPDMVGGQTVHELNLHYFGY